MTPRSALGALHIGALMFGLTGVFGKLAAASPASDTPVTGGLLFEMLSDPEPRDPNAPAPRYGVRGRGGDGPPSRGKGRPGGPTPRKGAKPAGGLKGVRKGKRR